MVDEFVKTIRLHLSERLTSPLFGAFLFSWCAWNYRLIMVALSNESVLAKIHIIDHMLYPDAATVAIQGVAAPLFTALAYLFGYPYPAKLVYAFTRKRQKEILEIRRRIEDETPLTVEDSKRIRNELARAEQEYFAELDRKDAEIVRLKAQMVPTDPAAQPAPETGERESRRPGLDLNLITMLALIEKSGGEILEESAIRKSGLPKIEAEYLFGELRRLGLLLRKYDSQAGGYVLKFTHEGRAVFLSSRERVEA